MTGDEWKGLLLAGEGGSILDGTCSRNERTRSKGGRREAGNAGTKPLSGFARESYLANTEYLSYLGRYSPEFSFIALD
jgi:hypothetical protein